MDDAFRSWWSGGSEAPPSSPTGPSLAIPPGGGPIPPAGVESFVDLPFLQDPTLSGNQSVWSTLVDGIHDVGKEIGNLSHQGEQAFAQAFDNVIDDMDLQSDLLGNRLADISLRAIPDGTTVHFSRVFDNPDFVKELCQTIQNQYPSLEREITSKGGTVAQYVQDIAQAYTGR